MIILSNTELLRRLNTQVQAFYMKSHLPTFICLNLFLILEGVNAKNSDYESHL